MPKTAKKKRGFMDVYTTTYDTSKGFGHPSQWKDDFRERMGIDEANEVLGGDDPRSILGVGINATATQIKSAWRRLMVKWHPDQHPGNEETATKKFKKILAAYTKLTEKRR